MNDQCSSGPAWLEDCSHFCFPFTKQDFFLFVIRLLRAGFFPFFVPSIYIFVKRAYSVCISLVGIHKDQRKNPSANKDEKEVNTKTKTQAHRDMSEVFALYVFTE